MVIVRTALQKTLDAKKTKQGDTVAVKLLASATIPGADAWPRNAVLLGHVDRVQVSENKSDSLIQITFDKAILKHDQVIPIKATIINLRPLTPPSGMNGDSNAAQSVASAGPQEMNGSGRSLNMSTPESDNPEPGHTPAYTVSRDAQDQNSADSWRAVFLKGIKLRSSVQKAASGTFIGERKNVHIPSQTELDIAVGELPAGSAVQ